MLPHILSSLFQKRTRLIITLLWLLAVVVIICLQLPFYKVIVEIATYSLFFPILLNVFTNKRPLNIVVVIVVCLICMLPTTFMPDKPIFLARGIVQSILFISTTLVCTWLIKINRLSQTQKQDLYQNVPVGLFRISPNEEFIETTRYLANLFGYKEASDLVGKSKQDLFLNIEDGLAWHIIMQGAGEVVNFDFQARQIDQKITWLRENTRQIKDETGKLLFYEGVLFNITEQRQAEAELRESEKRYRGIFENSPIALLEEDFSAVKQRIDELRLRGVQDFRAYLMEHPEFIAECTNNFLVLDLNQAAMRLYNAVSKEELIGSLNRIMGPGSEKIIFEELLALYENNLAYENTAVNYKLSGERMEILLRWFVSPVEQDSLSRVLISIYDITQERQSARAQSLFNIAIEQTPAGIMIADAPSLTVRAYNSAARQILGFTDENGPLNTSLVEYHPVWESFYPDKSIYKKEVQPLWRAILNGETVANDIMLIRRSDGSERWLLQNAAPLREPNGEVYSGIIVFTDITDRIQVEQALLTSERSFKDIINHLPDPTMVIDQEERLTAWNYAMEEITGIKAEDILGKGDYEYAIPFHGARQPILINCILHKEYTIPPRYYNVHYENDALVAESYAPGIGKGLLFRAKATPLYDSEGKIVGAIEIVRDITSEKENSLRIERQLERLGTLRAIDAAISNTLDLNITLNILLEQACECLKTDAASILLYNTTTQTLDFAASRGFRSNALHYTRLGIGEGFAGQVALTREILFIKDIAQESTPFSRGLSQPPEQFNSYAAAPLLAKGQFKGVLELFSRSHASPDQEWFDFLEALAYQAAIAIDNQNLYTELQRANLELSISYDTTLEGLIKAIDWQERYYTSQNPRIISLTLEMARLFNVSSSQLIHYRRGALLHDIGMGHLPDSILLKPGPLSPEEWELIHQHPQKAYELLSSIPLLKPATDIPYNHHEAWDGSGYPRGLKGEHIPLSARIFAVVDTWDAMNSNRPYRPALSDDTILDYIRQQSGKRFDPAVVEMFLKLIGS
jgi:PAS domain S-box-containing protein